MSPSFFDTNVFLYADDASSRGRQRRAIRLITDHQRAGMAMISLQVLQEYFAAATRKLGVAAEVAQRKVEVMSRLHVVRLAEPDVIAAIELHRLHRVSFWDALILQAARVGGAGVLFSEDLQEGAVIAGVRIANPFR